MHFAFRVAVGVLGTAAAGDGQRVVLGLQQPRDELQLVGLDLRGRLLQTEVVLEPLGHQVAVRVPPALHVRLRDQVDDLRALLGVLHAVKGEQVLHVAFLEADPAALHPAQLRFRPADAVRGLAPADPGALAKSAQLGAEDEPAHRRSGRRFLMRIVEHGHSLSSNFLARLRS